MMQRFATRHLSAARSLLIAVTALQLSACPQLAEDNFKKSGFDESDTDAGGTGGQATTTAGIPTTTGLALGGTGGEGDSTGGSQATGGTTADGTGGTDGSAGATDTGSGGSSAGATGGTASVGGTGGSDGSGGTGGSVNKLPTMLIYATTNAELYAARWNGTSFDAPALWDSVDNPPAFVEAHMAPDASWGIAAYQAEGSGSCSLWVRRFDATSHEELGQFEIGDADNCTTARAFDLAFEQQQGRALLVYALEEGELAYHIIDSASISQAESIGGDYPNTVINWVRLVSDVASDHIALGYSAAGATAERLTMQEWDGQAEAFGDARSLAANDVILDAQSFDFAYYQNNLIAVRGDAREDGFEYHLRDSDGEWRPGMRRPMALQGNAQVIALRTMPYGVAGVLYDAVGVVASLGAIFWDAGNFTEERRLDNGLPDVDEFESASIKADVARLGNTAVAVYSDAYGESDGSGSALGWATRGPDSNWALQHSDLPVPIDQESRGALPRSLRLARFADSVEGLVLVFGEDDGLYATGMTDLSVGFGKPELIDPDVDGAASTPFAVAGPYP